MVNRPLLVDMMRERVKGARVFPALFEDLVDEQRTRSQDYEWRGMAWPSSGLSLGMCPVKFFENQRKAKYFTAKSLVQMEVGKALHDRFGKRAALVPDLVYDRPRLNNRKLLEKLSKNWPSVSLILEPFSGEIDITIDDHGSPVISDWKFQFTNPGEVNVEDINQILELEEFESVEDLKEAIRQKISGCTDAWEDEVKKQPTADYKMQLDLYAYMANTLKIYKERVCKCRLLMFNICLAGEVKGYREVTWDFSKEREEEISAWHQHLIPYWKAAVKRIDIPCQSTYCRTHRKDQKVNDEPAKV